MKYANSLGLLVGLAAITLVGCSKELPATVASTPQKTSSSAEEVEPLASMVDQAAEFHRSRAADAEDLEELTVNTATIKKQDEQNLSYAEVQQENSESVDIADTKSVGTESSFAASVKTAEYLVRYGDTLGTIADRYSTTVAALASANAIDNPNKIEVGQAIRITL